MGIDYEDDGKDLPSSGSVQYESEAGDVVTYVDVDFTDYRRRVDNKAVKKNCTVPYWIMREADKEGVNYSQVLQDALVEKLHISR